MEVNHSLWEKIIPRVIASVAFAYLVYALTWGEEDLSYLHVIIFALVVVLVLAPFARRLKIPSVIDFESKMESLREETKKEIGEIRNQISTTLESHITPIQHQWTVVGMGEPLVKQLAQSITKEFRRTTLTDTIKGAKYTRNQFLRKADAYRMRAFDTLFLAHTIQLAIHGQKPPGKQSKDTRSDDERINDLISSLPKEEIHFFVPEEYVEETFEGLKAINNLLEIRKKVDSGEEPPNQKETKKLFATVDDTISGILAGVILQGWNAILYRKDMIQKLKELRESFGIKDDSPSQK
jgi:hypothetical protein